MTYENTLLLKSVLENAYPSLSKTSDEFYFTFLKEYEFELMAEAVNKFISTSVYPPTIAGLIQEYKNVKISKDLEIIHQMNKTGIFKHVTEYEKSLSFVSRGIVPDFLQDMIDRFLGKSRLDWQGEYVKQLESYGNNPKAKTISVEDFFNS